MKTVIIAGGSQGIGKATAELFNSNGYNIVVLYNKHIQAAQQLVVQLNNSGGNATAIGCDVRDIGQVTSMVEAVIKKYRHIDCLVISSGVAKQNMLVDVTVEEYKYLTDINLMGIFNLTKAVIPYMTERGGSIVAVSSILGQDGCSCESVYSMTKGGVNAFIKSIAKEYGLSGIRANVVCPGLIDTAMNDNLTLKEKQDIINTLPIRRIGTPMDVANAILFLAEHDYITATELNVDGGAKF